MNHGSIIPSSIERNTRAIRLLKDLKAEYKVAASLNQPLCKRFLNDLNDIRLMLMYGDGRPAGSNANETSENFNTGEFQITINP